MHNVELPPPGKIYADAHNTDVAVFEESKSNVPGHSDKSLQRDDLKLPLL